MSLNECSTVAVDMGKTIAMESKVLALGNVTHFASLLKSCDAACPNTNFSTCVIVLNKNFDSKKKLLTFSMP